ncbi:nucleotide pyrophosphohydrolase [Demequina muriae]|uniref:Nucleotide pyrophosphohydrolase n=1 Tax=Demequina muriae TaxID=3051664 RepID=A0ABT8GEE4_9MICO|nr:nucleotide pyrophosphohydrolase [Demequina sp. EGI L300058]MDN4479709.1 nucleotide pyrophosphohydrolase [Demequina sp. EGI L300058]
MTDANDSISALTEDIREFARERDWEQFHDPKSLILALVGEVGELAELFQWVPAADAVTEFAEPARKQRAEEEMADVLTYLVRLADVLGIDLASATARKMESSRRRFEPKDVRGEAPIKR